ncbi:MAG: dihydrofolate reductase, partial [Flavitalea sp.]
MRKLIAVMNMTLDGFCDHTSGIADEETHRHYADVINSADTIIYGRTTYQLMADYWPLIVKQPTGEKSTD